MDRSQVCQHKATVFEKPPSFAKGSLLRLSTLLDKIRRNVIPSRQELLQRVLVFSFGVNWGLTPTLSLVLRYQWFGDLRSLV